MITREMNLKLKAAINDLPPWCKLIFTLVKKTTSVINKPPNSLIYLKAPLRTRFRLLSKRSAGQSVIPSDIIKNNSKTFGDNREKLSLSIMDQSKPILEPAFKKAFARGRPGRTARTAFNLLNNPSYITRQTCLPRCGSSSQKTGAQQLMNPPMFGI